MIVLLYLGAVVAANLIVTALGPSSSVLTAFLFIGLNITARDRLHDAWSRSGIRWKMAALIAGGAGLSWLLNADAGKIALASFVAFAASETVDALVYHKLRDRSWFQRVNGSNGVSAAVDSLIFPTLAFGALLPWVVLGQFAAKVFGGGLWSMLLKPRNLAVAALLAIAGPLQAQNVSVGVGVFDNAFVQQEVVEARLAGPNIGMTPNLIAGWDIEGDGKPVVIAQVGRDIVVNFPVIIAADIGVSGGPWDDYKKWEPHVSTTFLGFIAGPLKTVVITSFQPFNGWSRSIVIKFDYTLWSR